MPDAPVSEIVQMSITQDSVVVQRNGYGIPLIVSCNATFPERARVYDSDADVLVDFASSSPEYLAAQAMFAQEPAPAQIYIGRAIGKPTLAYQMNISTVGVGSTYAVSVSGQGVTSTVVSYIPGADLTGTMLPRTSNVLSYASHGMNTGDLIRFSTTGSLPTGLAIDTNYWVIANTPNTYSVANTKANAIGGTAVALSGDGTGTQTIRRTQNDVICANLVQGLSAVVGANYTAVQVTGAGETDYITVTGNTAGAWFSLEVAPALIKSVMTHTEPSPTLATDLAAITNEQGGWYALYTLYNSDAYVKAAAAWVEANARIYIADLSASDVATAASGGSDTMQALATSAYKRTAAVFAPSPFDMTGAAWEGYNLPIDPGGGTWKFSRLAGVDPVDTMTTWRTNIRAKKGNVYVATTGGVNIMIEGTMADGGFIDTRRNLDFLQDDATKSIFEVLAAARKVPFTDAGIALLVNALRGSLKRCFGAGIINADFVITFPKARAVSLANRAGRILPDVKFSCTLQGAIHKVIVSGVVSV